MKKNKQVEAIEREETLAIKTIRKQEEGESRDWYQFTKRNNCEFVKFLESIKVAVVTDRENINEEMLMDYRWGECRKL